MRILVIEDEPPLLAQVAATLRLAGYAVDEASGGQDGAHLGLDYPMDLAVVDLGLPDLPGDEVIRRWRGAGITFPVIVLTARGR